MPKIPKHKSLLAVVVIAAILVTASARSQAEEPVVLKGHDEYVYTISFSHDGQWMATAAGDNTAMIWRFADRQPVHVLEHDAAVYAAAISPDSRVVATGTGERKLSIWDVKDGRLLRQLDAHEDAVYCVEFSPARNQLASAGGSTDGGDTTCRLWQWQDALNRMSAFEGHARQIYGLAFSPDEKLLATGSSDKTIRIWTIDSGKYAELKGHTSDVYRLAFSPTQQILASVSQDGSLRVWDMESGSAREVYAGGKQHPMYSVAFDKDGKFVAAVGDDGFVRIWRTNDWTLLTESRVTRSPLYAVAFAPGRQYVAAGGEDGKIYLLDWSELAGNPSAAR